MISPCVKQVVDRPMPHTCKQAQGGRRVYLRGGSARQRINIDAKCTPKFPSIPWQDVRAAAQVGFRSIPGEVPGKLPIIRCLYWWHYS